MDSINFWKTWYSLGYGSGLGSEGELKEFKIKFINSFIENNHISRVLDFGYGDAEIASQLDIKEYTGIDIVEQLEVKKNKFKAPVVELITSPFDKFNTQKTFELVNCIDVLYHILENEKPYLFATLNKIFTYSEKFVIIYAQDSYLDKFEQTQSEYNCPWRQYVTHINSFEQIFEQEECMPGSLAKFYIFKRKYDL